MTGNQHISGIETNSRLDYLCNAVSASQLQYEVAEDPMVPRYKYVPNDSLSTEYRLERCYQSLNILFPLCSILKNHKPGQSNKPGFESHLSLHTSLHQLHRPVSQSKLKVASIRLDRHVSEKGAVFSPSLTSSQTPSCLVSITV